MNNLTFLWPCVLRKNIIGLIGYYFTDYASDVLSSQTDEVEAE